MAFFFLRLRFFVPGVMPKKAIGQKPAIGPCIATVRADNRPACNLRKDGRRHDSEMGTTGERKQMFSDVRRVNRVYQQHRAALSLYNNFGNVRPVVE